MPTAKLDVVLTPEGRHLTFSKELLEVALLLRRVGGETGPWQRVAEDRAVFMGFMRGQHGKSLPYQLSATLPPAWQLKTNGVR